MLKNCCKEWKVIVLFYHYLDHVFQFQIYYYYINTSSCSFCFHTCTGLFLSFFFDKNVSVVHFGPSSGLYDQRTFSLTCFSSGVLILRVLTNSVTFCHWISQNGSFWLSLASSVLLSSSSFGLSALLVPPWPPLKMKIHNKMLYSENGYCYL